MLILEEGLPKAVIVTHGSVAASDAFNAIPLNGAARSTVFEVIRNKRCFVTMPAFHVRCLSMRHAQHSVLTSEVS